MNSPGSAVRAPAAQTRGHAAPTAAAASRACGFRPPAAACSCERSAKDKPPAGSRRADEPASRNSPLTTSAWRIVFSCADRRGESTGDDLDAARAAEPHDARAAPPGARRWRQSYRRCGTWRRRKTAAGAANERGATCGRAGAFSSSRRRPVARRRPWTRPWPARPGRPAWPWAAVFARRCPTSSRR